MAREQETTFRISLQLLDAFMIHGPNGIHQCLVLKLLGPSVEDVFRDYDESEGCKPHDIYQEGQASATPETILDQTEQLLLAIEYLHGAGFVHGGTE